MARQADGDIDMALVWSSRGYRFDLAAPQNTNAPRGNQNDKRAVIIRALAKRR